MTRALFVNQTGAMSGAEHSLLGLLSAMPPERIAGVACPAGPLVGALEGLGVRRFPLIGTEISFRLHPRHTTRGLVAMSRDARSLRQLTRRVEADVVHANTTRAGIVATLSGRLGGRPVLVHVRDWVPTGALASATLRAVQSGSTAMIANSEHVRSQLPTHRNSPPVHVVHNAVDTRRFDPQKVDGAGARARLGLNPQDVVLTVVGQLTPWKGQADAVRIAALLRQRLGPERVRLLVVGSAKFTDAGTRFDNVAFERELHSLVRELELEKDVLFTGEQTDVPGILAATDVLLVPSWQEAFGRVAIEGMAMGVPVLATANGGPAEVVRHQEDGLVLQPRSPESWATAAAGLLEDDGLRGAMGRNGRRRAIERFGLAGHAARVMDIHASVAR